MEDVELVAELLHEKLCKKEHTKGCNWFHYRWGDPKGIRVRYQAKARYILSMGVPKEDVIKVLDAL